jgi:hypothetical protein
LNSYDVCNCTQISTFDKETSDSLVWFLLSLNALLLLLFCLATTCYIQTYLLAVAPETCLPKAWFRGSGQKLNPELEEQKVGA